MDVELKKCSVCGIEFESENGLASCSAHSFGEIAGSTFVKVPVIRGFTEIQTLFEMLAALNGDAFICGGYVRFMCSPRKSPFKAGDVDVYCKDEAAYNKVKEMLSPHLEVRQESDVALTFKAPEAGIFQYTPPIQVIKSLNQGSIVASGNMEEILSNFDFTVIRCGLLSSKEALVDIDFLRDEEAATLVLKKIHCPISSVLRCMKYSKKGYWMTTSETLKLFIDWEGRDAAYRMKIVDSLGKSSKGETLSEEEINELEKLLRID